MGDQYDAEMEGVEGEEAPPVPEWDWEAEQAAEALRTNPPQFADVSQLVAGGAYEEAAPPVPEWDVDAEQTAEALRSNPPQFTDLSGLVAQAPYPRTASLGSHYEGEDDGTDQANVWNRLGEERNETYYASEEARQQFAVSAGEDGMSRGGAAFDTTTAEGEGGEDGRDGREIFVMDDRGQLYAADRNRQETEVLEDDQRFHHSSFLAGGDVAGAGEIQAREGTVEVISDRSGHYRPDLAMTGQVVSALEAQGQTAEAIGVELGGKGEGFEGEVRAGAIEVQAYRPDSPDVVASGLTPEALLRQRHDLKDDMLEELQRKTAGRRAELDAET